MAGGDLEALGCAVLDTSGLDVPFVGTGGTALRKRKWIVDGRITSHYLLAILFWPPHPSQTHLVLTSYLVVMENVLFLGVQPGPSPFLIPLFTLDYGLLTSLFLD